MDTHSDLLSLPKKRGNHFRKRKYMRTTATTFNSTVCIDSDSTIQILSARMPLVNRRHMSPRGLALLERRLVVKC